MALAVLLGLEAAREAGVVVFEPELLVRPDAEAVFGHARPPRAGNATGAGRSRQTRGEAGSAWRGNEEATATLKAARTRSTTNTGSSAASSAAPSAGRSGATAAGAAWPRASRTPAVSAAGPRRR